MIFLAHDFQAVFTLHIHIHILFCIHIMYVSYGYVG